MPGVKCWDDPSARRELMKEGLAILADQGCIG